MTTADIRAAKAAWSKLRQAIRLQVQRGTPSRMIRLGDWWWS